MNRRAQLLQAQDAIQRELKELEEREKFNGRVYVQCKHANEGDIYKNGGAIISIYYKKEDTNPCFPVVEMTVGNDTKFVPYEDKVLDEGVH